MELPSHRESDDTRPDQEPATTVNWRTVLVIAVVAAVLATIVIIHLIGVVGPAAH